MWRIIDGRKKKSKDPWEGKGLAFLKNMPVGMPSTEESSLRWGGEGGRSHNYIKT